MTSPKSVLVIENDSDALLAMCALLAHHGYEAIEATSGGQGVELASRHVPDLIVVDLHMPRMDGWETAAALRHDERTRDIPLVLVTGDWEAVESAPKSSRLFHSWLRKPLDLRTFGTHVRTIIGAP